MVLGLECARLKHPVSFDDLGIFVIPFSGWFKVTSRFDPDCDIDSGPLREVVRRARSVFGDFEVIDVTIGYKPCTPDGLPIIGEKTYMATGRRSAWRSKARNRPRTWKN